MPTNVLLSPAGLRMAEHLIGFPPRSIHELSESLRVTRTAVVEQLAELTEKGLVRRFAAKNGKRGRPEYLYTVTPDAMAKICPGNQHLLVPAIWNAIEREGGQELLTKIIGDVSETLAANCEPASPDIPFPYRVQNLVENGGFEECVVNPDGSVEITKRTCRFLSMFDASGTVCEIHLRTLARIADASVERIEYRHDGCPCCRFRIVENLR
ncbi:MAG: MarR family transcriptional regulator [Planctomycetia bacterium]|nr:MarR family transcriptional regulator [Planctomycetia bacterium]